MSRYLIVGAGRSGINAAQLLIKVGEDFISTTATRISTLRRRAKK